MRSVLILTVIAISLTLATQAQAALQFVLTTGNDAAGAQSLLSDSNNCPTDGPRAAYIAGELTNSGSTVETGISATLSGLGGQFALTGAQSATLNVGSLAAGDAIIVGWHIAFPCDTSKKKQAPPSSIANLSFIADGGSTTSKAVTVTARKAISANAGGQVLNTTLGAGAVVGQTITADVTYDFGNIGSGNEFYPQPAGNTDFDAACLKLVGSEVLTSNIDAIPVGSLNQLYFVSPNSQSGNGYETDLRFYYRYMCAGVTTISRPYSAQTSGNTNIKYTGNYDGAAALTFDFPTSTNPFTISKSATPSSFSPGSGPHTATYTVTVTNPSMFDTVIDGFSDTLPSGVSFQALDASGGVSVTNSSALPATGATGTLTFSGFAGSSYALAGGASLTLIYSAQIPDVVGSYVNSATAFVGSESIGPGEFTINVGVANLTGSKNVAIHDPAGIGLYALPGNDVIYTITIINNGDGAADADSITLIDAMPPEIEFYRGDLSAEPVAFAETGTGLTFAYATDVGYSDAATKPADLSECTYEPVPGYDASVTFICFKPQGAMAAGDPDPNFSVSFRARIR